MTRNILNLKGSVVGMLDQMDPTICNWFADNYETSCTTEQEEIVRMNAFWRSVLLNMNCDTIHPRSKLDDTMSHMEWTISFRRHLVPLLQQLPYKEVPWSKTLSYA